MKLFGKIFEGQVDGLHFKSHYICKALGGLIYYFEVYTKGELSHFFEAKLTALDNFDLAQEGFFKKDKSRVQEQTILKALEKYVLWNPKESLKSHEHFKGLIPNSEENYYTAHFDFYDQKNEELIFNIRLRDSEDFYKVIKSGELKIFEPGIYSDRQQNLIDENLICSKIEEKAKALLSE